MCKIASVIIEVVTMPVRIEGEGIMKSISAITY